MYLTAGLAGRARLGEEPWLDDEAAEEELASVVEEAVAGSEANEGASVRLKGICATSAGSGGISGELDVPRRLPRGLGGSAATDGMGARGGEYCVPASTVCFGEKVADVDSERLLLDAGGAIVGDWEGWRGNAAGGGCLMSCRGELVLGKRYDP